MKSKVLSAFSTPAANLCDKCGKGVYVSMPVFLDNGPDKPMTFLCHKAICLLCGDIKLYATDECVKAGIYRLNGDYSADWGLQFWRELKGVDIHDFIQLMLDEPKRQYYTPDELPREIYGHRAEFYEPQAEQAALPV